MKLVLDPFEYLVFGTIQVAFWSIQTIYISCKFMYGHPLNSCCDKKSDIYKTELTVNMFIMGGGGV